MSSSKEIDHDQDLCHVCWAKFIEYIEQLKKAQLFAVNRIRSDLNPPAN